MKNKFIKVCDKLVQISLVSSLFKLMYLVFLTSYWAFFRRCYTICWLQWQCQPKPRKPIQWVPDPVAIHTLTAFIPRGGHLHRDWRSEATWQQWDSILSQTGLSVPRDLQQLNSILQPEYLLPPYRRKEAMWLYRHLYQ